MVPCGGVVVKRMPRHLDVEFKSIKSNRMSKKPTTSGKKKTYITPSVTVASSMVTKLKIARKIPTSKHILMHISMIEESLK